MLSKSNFLTKLLTDVSGIQRLSVSDLARKLRKPTVLRRVRRTQAMMVTVGWRATCTKAQIRNCRHITVLLTNRPCASKRVAMVARKRAWSLPREGREQSAAAAFPSADCFICSRPE